MATKRKPWSAAELNALDLTAGMAGMAAYHKFGELTGYSKSFDAFEVKRRRIEAVSPAFTGVLVGAGAQPAHEQVTEAMTADYVGLTIAYWDLESTFSTQAIILYGAIADQFGRVTGFSKGPDITDDKELVRSIRDALSKYDIWVTWNGALFDIPLLNGRLLFHGLDPLPTKMGIDLMYKASGGSVRIGRRSLQSVSEYYGVANRKTPLTVRIWDKAMAGSAEAYALIAEHCQADVLVTRDVFQVLKPQIRGVQRTGG